MPVYASRECRLVISGIGKVRAAASVGSMFGQQPDQPHVAVNMGCCASPNTKFKIGTVFAINHVRDAASGRCFGFEMLLDFGLPESALTTVDRPADRTSANELPTLIDMEGSAFAEAAGLFLPPHRILCFKVVSDYLDPESCSRKRMSDVMERFLPRLERIVHQATALQEPSPRLSEAVTSLLERLESRLRLTKTQRLRLRDYTTGFLLRHGRESEISFLDRYAQQTVRDKATRNALFARICHDLLA